MNTLVYDWNLAESSLESQTPALVRIQDASLAEAARDPRVGPLGFEDARALVEQSIEMEVDCIDLGWVMDGSGLDRLDFLLQGFRGRQAACSLRAESNLLKALAHIAGRSDQLLEVWVADPLKGHNPTAALNCCRRAGELGLRPILTIVGAESLEPWRLHHLLGAASQAGCSGVHFFDAAGAMSVAGVGHVVRFARQHFAHLNPQKPLTVAWSGSDVHSLALAKALEAVDAGADVIRASVLGLGRQGYTPLELLLVNLRLESRWSEPLQQLSRYVQLASEKLGYSVPGDYPVFGSDAFRTATGVHAAAVAKAPTREMADRVYSSVPASWVGGRQVIEVGPMSGRWNVIRWLEQRQYSQIEPEVVEKILAAAKTRQRVLNELEIFDLMRG